MDSKTFVAELVEEMQDLFAQLGDLGALEAESGGRVEVVTLLKLALQSELEASEIAAYWLPTTAEIDARTVLAEQCSDEMRHYNLILRRLEDLGENAARLDPIAGGHTPLYQYLRSLRTTMERIAAGPFACEAVAEARNAQFIHLCHSLGDEATARLYEEIIQPEEIYHHRRGRELLEKYAVTPEVQNQVATAVRSTLAITDELKNLAEKTSGLPSLPVS